MFSEFIFFRRSVDSNQLVPTMAPTRGTVLIPQISDLDLLEPLGTALYHLSILWELTLLGEPVLVVANTPQQCSQVILFIKMIYNRLDCFQVSQLKEVL